MVVIGIVVVALVFPSLTWAERSHNQGKTPDRATSETSNRGDTPLHRAARSGTHSIIDILVNQGARVNRPNGDGSTPLHVAAEHGHTSVADRLIANGAEVNKRDFRGRTPLYRAAGSGHLAVVETLLKHNAWIDARTEGGKVDAGRTPLHVATIHGHAAVVEALLKGNAKITIDEDGLTPLHIAADAGNGTIVKLLLEGGATATVEDRIGLTPLHRASRKGSVDVVALLLDKGAAIDYRIADGATPLYFAIGGGHLEVAKLLVAKGANINMRDPRGHSMLHIAASSGNKETTQYLINQGAEINAKNMYGKTALDLATAEGHTVITELLQQASQDVSWWQQGIDAYASVVEGIPTEAVSAAFGASIQGILEAKAVVPSLDAMPELRAKLNQLASGANQRAPTGQITARDLFLKIPAGVRLKGEKAALEYLEKEKHELSHVRSVKNSPALAAIPKNLLFEPRDRNRARGPKDMGLLDKLKAHGHNDLRSLKAHSGVIVTTMMKGGAIGVLLEIPVTAIVETQSVRDGRKTFGEASQDALKQLGVTGLAGTAMGGALATASALGFTAGAPVLVPLTVAGGTAYVWVSSDRIWTALRDETRTVILAQQAAVQAAILEHARAMQDQTHTMIDTVHERIQTTMTSLGWWDGA